MIPVFVPSYHRPKATFLGRSLYYEFPMYVFVRKEDVLNYTYLTLRPNTTLVVLPEKVSNIGETRRAMFKYAVNKGIRKVFMIDDDVSRLDLSIWDPEKEAVRASGTVNHKREKTLILFSITGNLLGENFLLAWLCSEHATDLLLGL